MQEQIIDVLGPFKSKTDFILPSDPTKWPGYILQIFSQLYPELTNYAQDIVFLKIQEGNALGVMYLRSPEGEVQIPILIKDNKLLPIDLFINEEGQVTLLTPDKVIRNLEKNKIFAKPVPVPDRIDSGAKAIKPLAEPGQQSSLEKMAKLASISKLKALHDIFQQHKREILKLAFTHPKSKIMDKVKLIEKHYQYYQDLDIKKIAKIHDENIKRDVIQIIREDSPGKFRIRYSSTKIWTPIEIEGSYGEIAKLANDLGIPPARFLEFINKHSAVTINTSDTAITPTIAHELKMYPVEKNGTYITYSQTLKKKIVGNLFDYIEPLSGTTQKIFLTQDGLHCFISPKEKLLVLSKYKHTTPFKGEPPIPTKDYFIILGNEIVIGPVSIDLKQPTMLRGRYFSTEGHTYNVYIEITSHPPFPGMADTPDIRSYNLDKEKLCKIKGNTIFISTTIDQIAFVKVNPTIEVATAVEETEEPVKIANLATKAIITYDPIEQMFSLKVAGLPDKLESSSLYHKPVNFDLNKLSYDDLMFLLSHTYLPKDAQAIINKAVKERIVKLGNFTLPAVNKPMKDIIKEAHIKAADILEKFSAIQPRWDLIKIAAETNEEAVLDSVLELNLASPENMSYLIRDIPQLQETERKVAKMLFLARTGAIDYPDDDLKKLLVELNKLIEYLTYLSTVEPT